MTDKKKAACGKQAAGATTLEVSIKLHYPTTTHHKMQIEIDAMKKAARNLAAADRLLAAGDVRGAHRCLETARKHAVVMAAMGGGAA